jgi:carbon storage regulator CsrA
MLVLSRKLREQIQIGDNVTITILRVKGNSVRIGIEAPRNVKVVRGELPRVASPEGATVEMSSPEANLLKNATAAGEVAGSERRPATIGHDSGQLKSASIPADQARMSVFVSHPVDQRVIEISNDGPVRINEEADQDRDCDTAHRASSNEADSNSAHSNNVQSAGLHQRVRETRRHNSAASTPCELGAGQNRLRQIADAISKLS